MERWYTAFSAAAIAVLSVGTPGHAFTTSQRGTRCFQSGYWGSTSPHMDVNYSHDLTTTPGLTGTATFYCHSPSELDRLNGLTVATWEAHFTDGSTSAGASVAACIGSGTGTAATCTPPQNTGASSNTGLFHFSGAFSTTVTSEAIPFVRVIIPASSTIHSYGFST